VEQIRVKVRAELQNIEQLTALAGRVRNLTPAMNATAIIVRQEFAATFAAQGRPDAWAPLSPHTLAAKQGMFDEGKIRGRNPKTQQLVRGGGGSLPGILVRTGDLRTSYIRRNAKGNIHNVSADGQRLELGSSLPYAGYHETGHDGGKLIQSRRAGGMLKWQGVGGTHFSRSIIQGALPRRSVTYLSPEAMAKIVLANQAHVAGSDPKAAVSGGAGD
jgi:phage gpG-like protein